MDGCNINRPIGLLVEDAGFSLDSLRRFQHKGPSVLAHMYRGIATAEVGEDNYYRGLIAGSIDLNSPVAPVPGDPKNPGKNPVQPGIGPQRVLTYALEYNYYDGPWVLPAEFSRWNGLLRYFEGDEDDFFSITFMGYSGEWQSTDQIPKRAIEDGRLDIDDLPPTILAAGHLRLVPNGAETSVEWTPVEAPSEEARALIEALRPDVLAKGADYAREAIVGADLVESRGGRVVRIPLVPDQSSTRLVERIRGSS